MIPITLQTLVILIIATLLSWRETGLVLTLYLTIGAVGVPVFAEYTSGLEKLSGATAGFLWGFLIVGLCIAWLKDSMRNGLFQFILLFLLGHLLILICGFPWLIYVAEIDFWNTLTSLLPGLLVKSLLGALISYLISKKYFSARNEVGKIS